MQEILFFRELGFSLKQIKEIMSDPAYDRQAALELHRKMLIEKRDRLDQLITTIDKTIQHMKGEIKMTVEEKFQGFDFSRNPYEQEARERWGDQAVDESKAKLGKMSEAEMKALQDEIHAIYSKLAQLLTDRRNRRKHRRRSRSGTER